jgi:hypothetical protein
VRGALEEQMATYQRGNSTQEDAVKNATDQRKLGTVAGNMKYKWENQTKKAELRLGGEQE